MSKWAWYSQLIFLKLLSSTQFLWSPPMNISEWACQLTWILFFTGKPWMSSVKYRSWAERCPPSLPPVSKFFSFLFAQECKKAKSEKLTEILKSIESAAQEVLSPYFAFYIAPHFRMTWISTLRQRNRRFQRSPARILIIQPCLMQFLSPNLMIKVGYPKKGIHIHWWTNPWFRFARLRLIPKADTWLQHVTSPLERCWSLRSRCAASLLLRSLVCRSIVVGFVCLEKSSLFNIPRKCFV